MAGVLTEASNVTCGHNGAVATSGSGKLTVEGKPVLLRSGIEGKAVSASPPSMCSTPQSDKTSPCKTVTSVTAGESTKLKVGGAAVMLDTLKGTTDGVAAVPGTVPGTAVQDKLTAV